MLVIRGSRFQGLTPEGEQVLEWARRIVGDARTMREEMRAARHGPVGTHPHRRGADRARHGAAAHRAVPGEAPGRHLLHPVAHLARRC